MDTPSKRVLLVSDGSEDAAPARRRDGQPLALLREGGRGVAGDGGGMDPRGIRDTPAAHEWESLPVDSRPIPRYSTASRGR